MNSLLGADDNGDDVIINGETWVELDDEGYRNAFQQVKGDNARILIDLINLRGEISIDTSIAQIHFVDYDVPVVIIESHDICNDFFDKQILDTPGILADQSSTNNRASCFRIRLPFGMENKCCLFPFILMPTSPPDNLDDSPLLAHEVVHLKKTYTNLYNENTIRQQYWNADLQEYAKNNLAILLESNIRRFLLEEWEACEINFSDEMRQIAFTNVYIPMAIGNCASILDWWLNDENLYLNIGHTSKTISKALETCLIEIGYNDTAGQYPMSPKRWGDVSERCLREAYKSWKARPGNFSEKLKEAIQS